MRAFRFLALDTKNSKIVGTPRRGFASALRLPIEPTCPDSCGLKATKECYARGGRMAIDIQRLERLTAGRSALDITREAASEVEAAAAMGLSVGRLLRLFTAGDAATAELARLIAKAARAWIRSGGLAFGYTHAWRDVPRDAWRGVSIIASVESIAEAQAAIKRGYVPAKIVASHPVDGRAYVDEHGTRWIPCPEQTRGVPCVACGLCVNADRLRKLNAGIDFAAHGTKANQLKRRLPMLGQKPLFPEVAA